MMVKIGIVVVIIVLLTTMAPIASACSGGRSWSGVYQREFSSGMAGECIVGNDEDSEENNSEDDFPQPRMLPWGVPFVNV